MEGDISMNRENAWTTYEEADIKALEGLCKEYKDFLSNGKTERECVAQSIELAKKAGYQDLEELIKNKTPLKAGNKVYRTWMEKTIALFQIGEDAIEDGLNILGAHIDSPRLDLKQNPLYEDTEMALLDTHYYGGVKKYQWVTLPMALHGVVVKKDGTKVNICIGEKDEDPVVGITDLLIHLSGKQMQKKGNVIVEGEDLNVLIGSKPLKGEEKEAVKKQLLQLFDEEYGIEEDRMIEAMYVAAGIGQVIASRASLAGASGGCQAEIGSASGMAAAAICSVRGGSKEQMGHACAMALKNLMGLVCDPVAGLVEVPCVKRNVGGAVNALAAADMALAGIASHIPVDQVIDAMGEVGMKMDVSLRETSMGGVATSPKGLEIAERLGM